MMDKVNSLARTTSDQLMETMAAAMAAMKSPPSGDGPSPSEGGGGMLSRKSSRRIMSGASPGRGNSSRYHSMNNSHIRKTRSAQLKLDIDELSSGAALSRASSASLGLSFSFTGFNMPPEDIADSKPFSDDDIRNITHLGGRLIFGCSSEDPPKNQATYVFE